MKLLLLLCRALQAGESLSDPHIWKHRQQIINALLTLAGLFMPLLAKVGINAEDVLPLVTGIAIVGGLVNGYFTAATTDKIGLFGLGKWRCP